MENKYITIGTLTYDEEGNLEIDRELWGQGEIYRSEEAYFLKPDEICYIPELSNTVYKKQDFLDMCNGNVQIANMLFEQVDWQHPETLLSEWRENGEVEDCPICGYTFLSYEKGECPKCKSIRFEDNGEFYYLTGKEKELSMTYVNLFKKDFSIEDWDKYCEILEIDNNEVAIKLNIDSIEFIKSVEV